MSYKNTINKETKKSGLQQWVEWIDLFTNAYLIINGVCPISEFEIPMGTYGQSKLLNDQNKKRKEKKNPYLFNVIRLFGGGFSGRKKEWK